MQMLALYGDTSLKARLPLPGEEPEAASADRRDAEVANWDISSSESDENYNPNKPASAPNLEEEDHDDEPFRMILVLQRPED
jgi:hypothetical protein